MMITNEESVVRFQNNAVDLHDIVVHSSSFPTLNMTRAGDRAQLCLIPQLTRLIIRHNHEAKLISVMFMVCFNDDNGVYVQVSQSRIQESQEISDIVI